MRDEALFSDLAELGMAGTAALTSMTDDSAAAAAVAFTLDLNSASIAKDPKGGESRAAALLLKRL